ncbi:DUF4167 domain-containing protein [Methylocystis heyeri]|uniref:DUF4167 domain-containing protein n=1 Tax=Methylocystis heyeri TaxID=391905 RepID=A0A6B8KJL3_9HYPH|nr:DUF4167 domain-containing protein [Methylocystis heyeri]QGM47827.1 DUF4167 domain-containing protein [Methylocystis heyeri]
MRPGQNKRLRGRNGGRKVPNPLTRSFESNGPDVKIRGTAQHVAEKYLQLARDAQSSGDIVMAENLLQHAEHYFRLISAAQQQTNNYGRQSFEPEEEVDDDDDFLGVPDRFAPLAERLPAQQPNYPAPQPYQAPQPQVQPHFAAPQPQPQPFEERPFGGEMRHERQGGRQPFGGRNRGNQGDRGFDRGQDRAAQAERNNLDRNNVDRGQEAPEGRSQQPGFERGRGRFQPRQERYEPSVAAEQPDMTAPVGLPAFITAPPAINVSRSAPAVENPPPPAPEPREEGAAYNLAPRRRRRPRAAAAEAGGAVEEAPAAGELPLGD